jgi:hypothetical protein
MIILLNSEPNPERSPSIPQDKLARDDDVSLYSAQHYSLLNNFLYKQPEINFTENRFLIT